MSMKRTILTVRLPDGAEHTFPVTVADQVKLSETARRHKWDLSDGAGGMLGTIFTAWYGLHRRGHTAMTFDEFKVSDAELSEGEEDVDPTPPVTPPGSSPNSP